MAVAQMIGARIQRREDPRLVWFFKVTGHYLKDTPPTIDESPIQARHFD
jgi:hypothetical protein